MSTRLEGHAADEQLEYAQCATCGGPILFAPTVGSGFRRPVWTHLRREDWESNPHPADPVGRGDARGTTDTTAAGGAPKEPPRIDRRGTAVPTTHDVKTLIVEAEEP